MKDVAASPVSEPGVVRGPEVMMARASGLHVMALSLGIEKRAAGNRVLGRFRLENIRPAPRGVPQIEVTFEGDRRLRQLAAARHEPDGALHHTELLAERVEARPDGEQAGAGQLAAGERQLLREQNVPLDRLRAVTTDLRHMYQELASRR